MGGVIARCGALLLLVAALAGCSASPAPTGTHTSPLPSPLDPVTVRMEGESMAPVLDNGDLVIADRNSPTALGRGDIVLMKPPSGPGTLFVKRIIGIPGDVIEIDGRFVDPSQPEAVPHTAVLVKPGGQGDWLLLREPYLPDQSVDPWDEMNNCCDAGGRATSIPTPLTIPPGEYLVLGDNRNRSADSRSFGLVPTTDIVAKCLYRERGGQTAWLYTEQVQLTGT